MLPAPPERPRLIATFTQLGSAVEELLLAGLTTTSDATRQTLAAAMQEAARFRLLRLGSTLRLVLEELGRFTAQDAAFSRKRLTFFLNRAWLLSRGLSHALQTSDDKQYDRLTWSPPTQPVPRVDVICLGVVKRVAANAFVSFDFRLRSLTDAPPVGAGQKLTWSAVFPVKPGNEIPAEGYLHLDQKQKFAPNVFLEKKTIAIRQANLSLDDAGNGRLALAEKSTVAIGEPVCDWTQFLEWSPKLAVERIRDRKPGPLDLDTELQEEIVLRDYMIGSPEESELPGQKVIPIKAGMLEFAAIVGAEAEGETLQRNLKELGKGKERPPLYGLMHYERCRLLFQPLSLFRTEPDYLTISKEKINKAALLKTLKFT